MRTETPLLDFFIPGKPKAQPRVKATYRGGFIRMYTPNSAREWKEAIKRGLEESSWDGSLLNGAIAIDLSFYFPRPLRLNRKKDTDERMPHTVKPDKDNLEKAVLDSLSDAGLYRDDCVVFSGETSKYYVARVGSFMDEGCQIRVYQHESRH